MEDFVGLRFGNIHTKDLNLILVSSNNRYTKNPLPDSKDSTTEITGGNGSYYFGQTFDTREFSCEVAFDSITEQNWRKISQVFSTDKLQDLVFDELPYKTYKAKIKGKPEFKFVCFTDRETGQRVYKGEGTINFICYSPYALGLNKYIVKAADYYNNVPPKTIIDKGDIKIDDNPTNSRGEHPYAKNIIEPRHDKNNNGEYEGNDKGTRKDFFNINGNMDIPWEGGYPTINQVQAGELFYVDHENNLKTIIDTRGYWDNVPEWANTSRLLTTPTLDYDKELIFLPQYSKVDYINMDIGMGKKNAMIGSRLLVYNPGDVPIDFHLRIENNYQDSEGRTNWQLRQKVAKEQERDIYACTSDKSQRFQIRRFNVERLTIQEAVDWTGLETEDPADNEKYKYGNRYFKIAQDGLGHGIQLKDKIDKVIFSYYDDNGNELLDPIVKCIKDGKEIDVPETTNNFRMKLEKNHPNHAYMVEPIPREQLGHYIRTWFWQSSWILFPDYRESAIEEIRYAIKHFATQPYEGIYGNIVSEYFDNIEDLESEKDKVYKKIENIFINHDQKAEFYLYDYNQKRFGFYDEGRALAEEYEKMREKCILEEEEYELYWEYLHKFLKLSYDKIFLRGRDYIDDEDYTNFTNEIDFKNFVHDFIHNPMEFILEFKKDLKYEDIDFNISRMPQYMTQEYLEISTNGLNETKPIYIDTDKQIIYNIENPEYMLNNEELKENLYNYKPSKKILNDNIIKGNWFKLPPGWSLIEFTPIVDGTNWGDKIWRAATIFDWGYGGDKIILNNEEIQTNFKKPIQELYDLCYDKAMTAYRNEIIDRYPEARNLKLSRDEYISFRHWTRPIYYGEKTVKDFLIDYPFDFDLESNPLFKYINGTLKESEEKLYNLEENTFTESKEWYTLLVLEMLHRREYSIEAGYLRSIQRFWQKYSGTEVEVRRAYNGQETIRNYICRGNPHEWYWFACNYIWNLFPPVYWTLVDVLNNIQIKYTPLYY